MAEVYSWQNLARGCAAAVVTSRLKLEQVPKERLIVDLGCGDNYQVRVLTEQGFNALGVDYDRFLRDNPSLEAGDRFQVIDITERWPFRDGALGGVIGNAILDLLSSREIADLSREIRRCVGDGGFVFFSGGGMLFQNFGIIREGLKGSSIRLIE